ncbi:hypothetical protein [Shewanella sp.]|uniref:hypothetical protein n=1 Tax=Shewanella sp. TaxID=50422 RepID=UPI00356219F3
MIKRIHTSRPRCFSKNVSPAQPPQGICHPLHFCLTLVTFGLWALVWWYLILKQEGRAADLLAGFDDDYWSYLIEREQPPAALYPQQFGQEQRGFFEA